MPYVSRGDDGEINALHEAPTAKAIEYLEDSDPEVTHFVAQSAHLSALKQDLESSDFDMARVIEDLIGALVKKGVLAISDLPDAAREKLERRRHLRVQIHELPIVPTEDII